MGNKTNFYVFNLKNKNKFRIEIINKNCQPLSQFENIFTVLQNLFIYFYLNKITYLL